MTRTQQEVERKLYRQANRLANKHGTTVVANALRNVANDMDPDHGFDSGGFI